MVAYIQGFVKAYSAMYNLPQPNFNSHQAEFHRERSELKAIGFPRFQPTISEIILLTTVSEGAD